MSEPKKPRGRRIIRRERPVRREPISWSSLRPAEIWSTFKSYFGLGRAAPLAPIDTLAALGAFLDTRASFIAQASLYGYLRTRAGMRYPELFDDDPFVEGINIAKWHIWLDCLSDLAVYTGSRLAQQAPRDASRVAALMVALVDDILENRGAPAEAGAEFAAHAERVRDRVARTDWLVVGDKEAAFTESPAGLVRWAPVMDELKQLDEEIVRNSVRFRWQEVRRDFARYIEPEAVLNALPDAS
ncbi:MAG: esterase [Gammaproteobacteria bacterium]